MPYFGNQMGDDPLGIAIQGRAQQGRQQFNQNEGWGHPSFGPLPDPKWAGLFQAMNEQGVDKVGDNSVGVDKGMWSAPAPNVNTFDPRFQTSAISTASPQVNNKGEYQGHLMQERYGANPSFGHQTPKPEMMNPYQRTQLPNGAPDTGAAMQGLHSAFRPQGQR